MRISDWSSDVCSSDLLLCLAAGLQMVLRMGIPKWFPAYMERSYGIERVQVGRMIASTNTLGMMLGIFAAGPLADRLAVRKDRTSVVSGVRVSVRVSLGGLRTVKTNNTVSMMYSKLIHKN